MTKHLWRIGDEYAGLPLDPDDCDPDPIVEVRAWLEAAIDAGVATPNAMTLATVDAHGKPAARIVLLKELDTRGFVFFTNYDSRKGRDLAAHPAAALVLFWEPMHRQVRVEGTVERVTAAESDEYFASRARGSQLGAIASPQSQVIAGRDVLEQKIALVSQQYGEQPLPRPANWGGYRVVPELIELWQGQPSRLHDRVRYRLVNGAWVKDRLAP
ncbi:MAG TPA: pyridoxamine 5'-phosphate oxidase [Kofleriaceae bacterium]|nr:pyridoxamine 5'-phosphate oxidase [Kofleriaceae bacterium]